MKPEFIVLTLILFGALYLFWTQRLRTDIAALLVMSVVKILGAERSSIGQQADDPSPNQG